MGYLDNSSITIDAILTKWGKRKLAEGQALGITYFGLSDDGVDYQLWNEGNVTGSDQYGQAIEDLPQLEAFVDANVGMRYKLGTGIENMIVNPYIVLDQNSYLLTKPSRSTQSYTIIPQTANLNDNENYDWYISSNSGINWSPGGESLDDFGLEGPQPEANRQERMLIRNSPQLEIWAAPNSYATVVSHIQVVGVSSGATASIRVTSEKQE